METLKLFPLDDQALIKNINAVIGRDFISQSANFIEAFNQDVETLNHNLNEPPSYRKLLAKGAAVEHEYNELMAVSQDRWDNTDKRFDVGANAIRNLAAIRKEYNEALREIRTFEVSQNDTKMLCHTGVGSVWKKLEQEAARLDATDDQDRKGRLKTLVDDWTKQDLFATFDSGDLIHYLDEIYDFKWFLELMKQALKRAGHAEKLYAICLENEQVLNKQEERIMHAMAWRIKAGSMHRNLNFDDSYIALVDELKSILGESLLKKMKMIQPNRAQSFGMGPSRFLTLSRLLLKSKDDSIRQKLYNIFWVNNDKMPIPLIQQGTDIIPKALKEVVPTQKGWSPINWIRYYFFKVIPETTPFWIWLKKLQVGKPSHVLILMNDAVWQMQRLVSAHKQFNDINQFVENSGFKASLSIHKIIAHEKLRIDRFKLPWFLRIFLKIPILSNATTTLIDGYTSLLDKVQSSVETQAKLMVTPILKRLNKALTHEIQENLFLMPKDLLHKIEQFVKLYGSQLQKAQFRLYTSPLYVLKHFNFFMADDSNPYFRELNQDAVDAFLRYAEKYWTGDEIRAAYHLMDLVTGAKIPQNKNEEKELAKNLLCLVKSKDSQKEIFQLLQWIGGKVIARCGDLGNPLAYRFLKRFAPDKADIWKEEKEAQLDEKFTDLVSLFRKSNGHETNLNEDLPFNYRHVRKFIHDLTFDPIYRQTYLPGLIRGAEQYLAKFDGRSDAYTIIFYWISTTQGNMKLFHQFLDKRFKVVFDSDKPMTSIYEQSLLEQISKDPYVINQLRTKVQQSVGQSTALNGMLTKFGDESIRGLYLAKRLIALYDANNVQQLKKEKQLFDSVQTQYDFQEPVSLHFKHLVHVYTVENDVKALTSSDFHDWLELYGNTSAKEAYRLARIEQLFTVRDKTLIDEFFMQLEQDLGTKDLSQCFTLKSSKSKLKKLFMQKADFMLDVNDWHGNWQYIMEHFDYEDCKPCVEKARMAWLNEYMFETEQFAKQGIMYRNTQDLNVHFKNSEIPNDRVSMEDFFGRELKPTIALCFKRIDQLDLGIEPQVLTIMDKYFQDEAVRVSPKYSEYRKKLSVLKKARKFYGYLEKENYESARLYLDQINEGYFALQARQDSISHLNSGTIMRYQKQVIQGMENSLEECYKQLAFPVSWFNLDLEQVDDFQPSNQLENFEKALLSHREKLEVKSNLKAIKQNKAKISKLMINLLKSLHPDRLDKLDFSPANAQLLALGLSQQAKKELKRRFFVITDSLSFDKRVSDAAKAFFRVVLNRYLQRTDSDHDLKLLKRYKSHPINKESLVNQLVTTVGDDLEVAPWDKFDKIVDLDQYFLKSFLQSANKPRQRSLANILIKHIAHLFENSDLNTMIEQQDHWCKCGQLYSILNGIGAVNSTQKKAMSHMLDLAVEYCQAHMSDFTEPVVLGDLRSSFRAKVNQAEESLYKNAMFIRAYGERNQQLQLDQLLAQITQWQRVEVMGMDKKPIEEHKLNFSFDLIQATANDKVRLSNARLQRIWSSYQGSPTQMNSKKVQRQALLEIIPDFTDKVVVRLFDYFIDKFEINDIQKQKLFYSRLAQMRQKAIQADRLLELEDIEKLFSLADFKQLIHEVRQGHGFFSKLVHKTSDLHAKHLMAAFHVSVRAAQLAKVWTHNLKSKPLASNRHFSCEVLAKPLLELLEIHQKDWVILSLNAYNGMKKAITDESQEFGAEPEPVSGLERVKSKLLLRAA